MLLAIPSCAPHTRLLALMALHIHMRRQQIAETDLAIPQHGFTVITAETQTDGAAEQIGLVEFEALSHAASTAQREEVHGGAVLVAGGAEGRELEGAFAAPGGDGAGSVAASAFGTCAGEGHVEHFESWLGRGSMVAGCDGRWGLYVSKRGRRSD